MTQPSVVHAPPVPFYDPTVPECPSRQVLDRVGDRWTALVVLVLSEGPHRFTALSQRIGTVSQKMLTQTLRGLERDGMVTRTVHAEVPPRVDYQLTELGWSLYEPIVALSRWAEAHVPQIEVARETYDRR